MTDKPIRPKAQALSDALMMTRYAALWLKHCALISQTKMLELQDEMMAEPNSKMMGMETGEAEQMLLELAGQHGKVKHVHALLNAIGRRHNEPMPKAPNYDERYIELAGKSVETKLSSVTRR
jgi:hypothetical protein